VVTSAPTSSNNGNVGTTFTATATCTTGKAISGGGSVTNPNGQFVILSGTAPTGGTTNPTGWTATAMVSTKNNSASTVTAYVVCG
jgi:hypothetical protein